MSVSNFSVPILYRHILKAARRFPSIKRNAIIEEIRTEFRDNKALKDRAEIEEKLKIAVRGLEELEQYSQLDPKSKDWDLYLRGMCP